jgi:hypothetical protein
MVMSRRQREFAEAQKQASEKDGLIASWIDAKLWIKKLEKRRIDMQYSLDDTGPAEAKVITGCVDGP